MVRIRAGLLMIGLSGCAELPQRYQLAAEPLAGVAEAPPLAIDRVHVMVQDSETKCAAFVNSMFVEQAGSGLALDVAATGASALATVFTPIAAVHALTAVGTIVSGTRTSLSAEYLSSLTLSHVAQTIQATYSVAMRDYVAGLASADAAVIDPWVERSRILAIHDECSLASASGTINATLTPGVVSVAR